MSTRHRGKILGDAVMQEIPLPAGGVKLETFVPWTLIPRGLQAAVTPPPGVTVAFARTNAIHDAVPRANTPVSPLVRALGLAHHWQRLLDDGKAMSVQEIADSESIDVSLVRRFLRLTLLAPEVIERLLADTDAKLDPLIRKPLPHDWQVQRRMLTPH
jgi:hypothetical protein